MPLLDHVHPPLSVQRHWEGFQSKWAGAMVDRMNEELPDRYFAEPHIHPGSRFEVDVGTFDDEPVSRAPEGGSTTLVWSPSQATVSLPLDFAGLDTFEVRVMHDEGGPTLVAAIELVPCRRCRGGSMRKTPCPSNWKRATPRPAAR